MLGFDLADEFDLTGIAAAIVDDPSARRAHAWLLKAKRAGLATVAICDLASGSAAADLVVDGHVAAGPIEGLAARLHGPRFVVLDPRLLAARAKPRVRRASSRPRVLVALGGGAHVISFVEPLALDIARRCPNARISIAAGFSTGERPRVGAARWIARPDGLARDLAASDVAVVAGGMTLYEACAVGIPAVAVSVVPAQRPAIEAFAAQGAAIDAGMLPNGGDVDRAGTAVALLLGDQSARRRLSAAGRHLIDGRGALRLATRLRALARGFAT
jgi:spore coat polysaccharide biosynthesis predicted glycosyltransferase SpsG